MELEYICPECKGDMVECLPFANTDNQLRLTADLRHHKPSGDDMYGSATVIAGDPAYVCWNCECVYPRSLCRVRQYEQGKMAAANDVT
jgi:hypothetical protein